MGFFVILFLHSITKPRKSIMSRATLGLLAALGMIVPSTICFGQSSDTPPIGRVVAQEVEVLVGNLIGKDGVGGSLKSAFDQMVQADDPSGEKNDLADLLNFIDVVAQAGPAQAERLKVFQRLLAGIESEKDAPTQQSVFSLSTLYIESKREASSKLSSEHNWISKLEVFESSVKALIRLSKVSANPHVTQALNFYQPRLEAWNVRKKTFTDEVESIQKDIHIGFESVRQRIIDSLYGTIKSDSSNDVKVFAANSLLRLAVFEESNAAADKFVEVAGAETASADPVFLKSLANIRLLKDFKLDEANSSSFSIDSGIAIIAKIVSNQSHSLDSQRTVTKWVREILVNESFAELRPAEDASDVEGKAKFEKAYLNLETLLRSMNATFHPELQMEIDSTRKDLQHIRFIGPIVS
jgi:hypothetical protein